MFSGLTDLKFEKIKVNHIFINQIDANTPYEGLYFYSPKVSSNIIIRFFKRVIIFFVRSIKTLLRNFIFNSKKLVKRSFRLVKKTNSSFNNFWLKKF